MFSMNTFGMKGKIWTFIYFDGRFVVDFLGKAPSYICEYVAPRLIDCLAEIGRYKG